MRMKYRPYKEPEDVLMVGDIRRYTINGGGMIETFYAAVVSVTPDSVSVKRLYKEDSAASRYLIRDVAPTGLEYAMFVDTRITKLSIQTVGRKAGKLSKSDLRNIRK